MFFVPYHYTGVTSNSGNMLEVDTLEYCHGDRFKKYILTVPMDMKAGQLFQVSLDNHLFSALLPPSVKPGEKIIVKAPIMSGVTQQRISQTASSNARCHLCTFENAANLAMCAMCGEPISNAKSDIPSVKVLELIEGTVSSNFCYREFVRL